MRSLFGSLFACGILTAFIDAAEPQDPLFTEWEQAQRGIQSLVVEFTLDKTDAVFKITQKAEGAFRLLRTPKGELFASYELSWEKLKGEKPERFAAVLNKGTVYICDAVQKIELGIRVTKNDLPGFLEDYFNPFVPLLDRKRAEEKWNLDVKEDEAYIYLSVKPKQMTPSRWFAFSGNFQQGRVVLMNNDSKSVPKSMPRQLWFTGGNQEFSFDIKTWRINAPDGPKVEEFARPENRPGWRVDIVDWPLESPFTAKATVKP